MIQSLQRRRESLPLSCKCAIGILAFLRMDTLYFVSFGNTRTQAGDAVSMFGSAFDLDLLLAVCHWDLTRSWQVAPSHILIPGIATWKSSTFLQVCHWDFSFFENGHPLFCFFWKYQNASWRCCFNAWLSFWPGIVSGSVPLGFDSKLTGRTFPYSDSWHS